MHLSGPPIDLKKDRGGDDDEPSSSYGLKDYVAVNPRHVLKTDISKYDRKKWKGQHVCWRCEKQGHIAKECPYYRAQEEYMRLISEYRSLAGDIPELERRILHDLCYACGAAAHNKENGKCPRHGTPTANLAAATPSLDRPGMLNPGAISFIPGAPHQAPTLTMTDIAAVRVSPSDLSTGHETADITECKPGAGAQTGTPAASFVSPVHDNGHPEERGEKRHVEAESVGQDHESTADPVEPKTLQPGSTYPEVTQQESSPEPVEDHEETPEVPWDRGDNRGVSSRRGGDRASSDGGQGRGHSADTNDPAGSARARSTTRGGVDRGRVRDSEQISGLRERGAVESGDAQHPVDSFLDELKRKVDESKRQEVAAVEENGRIYDQKQEQKKGENDRGL